MSETITVARASKLTAGIDTGKEWLDVGLSDGSILTRRRNEPQGHQALAEDLKRLGVRRVGIEATGGYEAAAVRVLRREGVKVRLLQPRQVKAYAQFRLRRAKSDRIDAALIARCAAELGEPPVPPDGRLAGLSSLLTLIEQIGEDIVCLKTRLEHVELEEIAARHKAEIRRLKAERSAWIKRLDAQLRQHRDLARKADLVESIDGVGLITALTMVIRMPELGTIDREEAASLLGAAPFVRQSGKYEGERHVEGGRARPRTALFACAQAAIKWNKPLSGFYKRLMMHGKHHRVAAMACTRKLVVIINAVLARGTNWTSEPPPKNLLAAKP